jgi:hypothetical protein
MTPHSTTFAPTTWWDPAGLPRRCVVVGALALTTASVAACAALAFLMGLLAPLPPQGGPVTRAMAISTPPAWAETSPSTSVPHASTVFASRSWADHQGRSDSSASEEAAPTF